MKTNAQTVPGDERRHSYGVMAFGPTPNLDRVHEPRGGADGDLALDQHIDAALLLPELFRLASPAKITMVSEPVMRMAAELAEIDCIALPAC